ncbi:unnamed protein product [Symbiodinium sp. CCMP2592]|nr:unnamed protein product [Symbiodinium sp. CCMP2592]
MSTPHAAWISAAVKAACQSGAPRRTVAAVAAAVTTAILQQTAKATPARTVEEHTGTAAAGLSGDCEALAEQLREARAKKRRDKRQRRRDRAQAAASPVPPTAGGDGRSEEAVEGAAMEEMPDTTEDPHPKLETELQSPLSAGNLQARDAQSTPEALAAQGVHFLPEERVVPDRRPSLASSAPTDFVIEYHQRREGYTLSPHCLAFATSAEHTEETETTGAAATEFEPGCMGLPTPCAIYAGHLRPLLRELRSWDFFPSFDLTMKIQSVLHTADHGSATLWASFTVLFLERQVDVDKKFKFKLLLLAKGLVFGRNADLPIVVAFNWDHAEFIMPRDWVRQLPLEGEWSDASDKARVREFLLMSLEAKIQLLENSNETDLCRYLKARIQEFLVLESPRRSVGSFLAHFGFQSEEEAIRQREGMGPVACAVLSCDMDMLHHFAGAGAPTTTRLPLMYEVDQMAGYTPVHLAVLVGRRTLLPLEELLRLRADPNTKDSMGAPVLGTCRTVGAVELLLRYRADVNLCGLPTKATPLTRACAGLAPKDVLEKLIDSKAAINGYGAGLTTTPLANLVSFSKDTQEDQQLVSFLLQRNADPNFAHGIRGTWRLLELGCRAMQLMGREETMLRYFGEGSTTPLGYAAIAGNPQLVSCLLSARADPNLRNRRGNTPMQLALTANVQIIFRQTCGSSADFNEDEDDPIVEVYAMSTWLIPHTAVLGSCSDRLSFLAVLLRGLRAGGMPRSIAQSSSTHSSNVASSSAGVASSSSDGAGGDNRDEAAAAAAREAERKAATERRHLLDQVARRALFELCMLFWEAHVKFRVSDGRAVRARVDAQRRNWQHLEPGDVYAILAPQMEQQEFERLHEEYGFLGGLFDQGVRENDKGWICSTGASADPPKHLYFQHLSRLAQPNLQRGIVGHRARTLMARLLELLENKLYVPAMYALFPLLGMDGQRAFQQWFVRYSLGILPDDADLPDEVQPAAARSTSGAAGSSTEVTAALKGLPSGKAVPASLPPAVLWKEAADLMAPDIAVQINSWLADMRHPPPDGWHIADIFLLLKPGKPPSPSSLRPISLLHPVAKAIAVILKQRLQPAADAVLSELPQFAYLQNRSAQDALDRAFTHCCHVQSILRAQTATPQTRYQGHTVLPCRGGITLSVDLRKAFDLMPRAHLLTALQNSKADPALVWTIMSLHSHAQMQFSFGPHKTTIDTENGIRQGCGLAPTLWSMFTAVVMVRLLEQLKPEELSAFADDWLFQWVINKPEDVVRAVRLVGFVLDVLHEFGMQPSLDKTVILIKLKGSQANRIIKEHVSRKHGKGRVIKIATESGQVELPVVEQHTYLGCQLSYTCSELLTIKHRVRQSWNVFNRLLPSLRSVGLTRALKLEVWRACAYASLMYGLDCVVSSGHVSVQHPALRTVLKELPSWLAERRATVFSPCQWKPMAGMEAELQDEPGTELLSAQKQMAMIQSMAKANPTGNLGAGAQQVQQEEERQNTSEPSAPSAPTPSQMDTSNRDHKRGYHTEQQKETPSGNGNGHGKGPNKWPKTNYKGGHSTDGSGWGSHKNDYWSKQSWDKGQDKETAQLAKLCTSMARLVLRHEDQQSIDRSEKGFILFCQAKGLLSIVPDLKRTAEAWTQQKEQTPEQLTLPMRSALLHQLVEVWYTRMEAVPQTEESRQNAREMLILDSSGNVPYLQYNREEQKLEIKKDRDPMTLERTLEMLLELKDLVLLPLTTLRFHAARRRALQNPGEIVPMMLEVGLRTSEADRAWNILARLSHSGACRAVALSMRQERLGRSMLAQNLQKILEELSGA